MLKAADAPELTKTDLLDFYRQMKLIREFERESERQYTRGNIKGFLHVYNGAEAIAAVRWISSKVISHSLWLSAPLIVTIG